MIVIEGLKDGPVEGKATVLILYGNGSVHEECGEYLHVKVGTWKALKPHGRLIDADKLLDELSECEMQSYGYKGSCDDCEDRNICKERILIQRIKDAPTILEASE